MGNAKARKARAREAREAQNSEAREAQDREAREAQHIREDRAREATARYARWKAFRVCTVLGSITLPAVLGFKSILEPFVVFVMGSIALTAFLGFERNLFYLLPFELFGMAEQDRRVAEQDRRVAGIMGMLLGMVGERVLGLHNWVWSWILPIVSFKIMENRKPVWWDSVPIVLLLGVERVVLIVGVAVLGWRWGFALDVIIIIVETKTNWRWASEKLATAVQIAEEAVIEGCVDCLFELCRVRSLLDSIEQDIMGKGLRAELLLDSIEQHIMGKGLRAELLLDSIEQDRMYKVRAGLAWIKYQFIITWILWRYIGLGLLHVFFFFCNVILMDVCYIRLGAASEL